MKAAIYNPYLDTLGGGERYTIAVATTLEKLGYKVEIQWPNPEIGPKIEKRFGIKLKNVNFVEDIKRGDSYDVCFWVSDGSIPALKSRKNFLHFQIPFTHVNGITLLNKMKLFRIKKIICNSYFTKRFIDYEYGVESVVLYPPVDTKNIKPKHKENLILSVARFSQLTQSKNQHILIESFKKLYNRGLKTWRLVLAGGVEVGAKEYVEGLKKIIKDYPITILESPSFAEIKDLYGRARIFWSAVGLGENEETNPKKVEHFGITIVESMAAGAVPIATALGGHKEIIKHGLNGVLFKSEKGLEDVTKNLVEEKKVMETISKNAIIESKKYSYENFEKEFSSLL
ncbi:MAG: glycosyltransferase family 4 protein [Candidatus Woesebacteria bacterium]|nr:MAG: glycosyltransferase family 4 protein [Candidatus Woesebacteria bacterium]